LRFAFNKGFLLVGREGGDGFLRGGLLTLLP
jgi:hypothetical protein